MLIKAWNNIITTIGYFIQNLLNLVKFSISDSYEYMKSYLKISLSRLLRKIWNYEAQRLKPGFKIHLKIVFYTRGKIRGVDLK